MCCLWPTISVRMQSARTVTSRSHPITPSKAMIMVRTLIITSSLRAFFWLPLCTAAHAEDIGDAARMNFSAQEFTAQQLDAIRSDASIPAADHGKWLNEKIPTAHGPVAARTWLERNPGHRSGRIHLVADPAFLSAMAGKLLGKFVTHSIDDVGPELVEKAAGGDCLVWIGRGDKLLPELSVRTFTPNAGNTRETCFTT